MESLTQNQCEDIARQFMQEIMYDNGVVNRLEPEIFPKKHVNAIALKCKAFFEANPRLLTNENINEICCGEHEKVEDSYGKLTGYSELSYALGNYFEQM